MKNWKRVIEESGKVEAGRGRGSKNKYRAGRGGAGKAFDGAGRGRGSKKIQSGAGVRSGEENFRRGGAGSKKSTPFRPLIYIYLIVSSFLD